MRRNDKKIIGGADDAEAIVVLPPPYIKRYLQYEYWSTVANESLKVSRKTFVDVLSKDKPFIRLFIRTRMLCDLCFAYHDTVRTASDKHLTAKANEWRLHLDAADSFRELYRESQESARQIHTSAITHRIQYAVISYDYARQLSITLLSEQTRDEWFSQKRCYEVNLFEIVDEGRGGNGKLYKF